MDINKIKLVIWDLDNTFWSGSIKEGGIQLIPKNIELVKSLTHSGIVNSICSKNTYEVVADKLNEIEMFDYFVFPSIDWTSKGHRINDLIKDMSLRAENVLFIDDEVTNLEEAKHYAHGIMTATPDEIEELTELVATLEKKDLNHNRLNQYKLLEQKRAEKKEYNSNEDFLYACNVKLNIIEDCMPETGRIHELLSRSNQLNYTKKRISETELKALLENSDASCAYITVNDKFGDYGIVGFYALIANKLEHYLFSCRVMGLGAEQFVYSTLNYPTLEVVGEVVSPLTKAPAPAWINNNSIQNVNTAAQAENPVPHGEKFLFKSPCDFSQTIAYLTNDNLFRCEFDYVGAARNNVITGHNHSVFLSQLKDYSPVEKQEILRDCIFYDEEMFNGTIYTEKYDIVFLSTFIDAFAGIYQKKNSDIQVTAGSYLYPLTDQNFWPELITGKHYSASNTFTEEYLKEFSEKYEFRGKSTPEDYCRRISKILNDLDKETILCLILGVEFPCEKNTEPFYVDRHLAHIQLNEAIRKLAKNNKRLKLLDMNELVKSQNDLTVNLNEFPSRINYDLSKKVISIINESVQVEIGNRSSLLVHFDVVLNNAKRLVRNIIPKESGLYASMKNMYFILSRKRL